MGVGRKGRGGRKFNLLRYGLVSEVSRPRVDEDLGKTRGEAYCEPTVLFNLPL